MKILKLAQEQKQKFPKIHIIGLQQMAEYGHLYKDFNVISIRDTTKISKEYQEKYNRIDSFGIPNIYVATFDDLSHEDEASMGTLPQKTDVQSIIEWAKQKWSENHLDFIVHCTAGISRSSAIATLISHAFNNPKAMDTFDGKYHFPNQRIMGFGEEILNQPNLKDKTREKAEREFGENLAKICKNSINSIF